MDLDIYWVLKMSKNGFYGQKFWKIVFIEGPYEDSVNH